MDPADQTLVGDLSQDADASVVKEVAVSGFPILGLSSSPSRLLRFDALSPFVLLFSFCFRVFFDDRVGPCTHSDLSFTPAQQDVPLQVFDAMRKIVVEEDEDNAVPDVTPIPVEPKPSDPEPPTFKAVEVDATSDPTGAEHVVGHVVRSLVSPPFLTSDLLSLQADFMKDNPVPSEGLPSLVLGGGYVTYVSQSL